MKKLLVLLLAVVFCLASVSFAGLVEKKNELKRVRQYIILLDKKIKKARVLKNRTRVIVLQKDKKSQLLRAKRIKQQIAQLEKIKAKVKTKAGIKPVGQACQKESRGWQLGLGYGGGAIGLDLGYYIPGPGFDFLLDLGYGTGGVNDKYYVGSLNLAAILPLGGRYLGLELGLANFSERVADIPGVSGQIAKGSKFGAGIFAGAKVGVWKVQVGYHSAMGATAKAVYKF